MNKNVLEECVYFEINPTTERQWSLDTLAKHNKVMIDSCDFTESRSGIFKFLFTDISSLEYRSVMDFYVLVSYSATLLYLFVVSDSVMAKSSGLSSAKSDSSTSSSPIWMPLTSPAWMLWPGFPVPCWITAIGADTPTLFLISEEKRSVFTHWVRCEVRVCHL